MIYLVRNLSREAIEFLEKRDLVTIPPLLKEDYWEESKSLRPPGAKRLRGNNMFFARATVFHELIPGHHMQFYMTQRYRIYRSLFSTPFWTEGMAFYWELLLWDLGFTRTPEQRVGRANRLLAEFPP